ncbi:unnamed protein product [Vicia faba]|uniref:Uncharacterized protein n=1 Tax=Vicia faba TaxID=3906 RepID=A0AAV0ZU20_VICFA|nr:unnamed protein product [Vicia faba]
MMQFVSPSSSTVHTILRNCEMARPFEKIADISGQKELWKVFVRVHYKWTVITNNNEHLELIFVDDDVTLGFCSFNSFEIVVMIMNMFIVYLNQP